MDAQWVKFKLGLNVQRFLCICKRKIFANNAIFTLSKCIEMTVCLQNIWIIIGQEEMILKKKLYGTTLHGKIIATKFMVD